MSPCSLGASIAAGTDRLGAPTHLLVKPMSMPYFTGSEGHRFPHLNTSVVGNDIGVMVGIFDSLQRCIMVAPKVDGDSCLMSYSSSSSSAALLSRVSVTRDQLGSNSINWEIPEINN